MSRHITVEFVAPGERLTAQGGGASIHVRGDVGEDAVLTAQGGQAEIIVDGNVDAHARLTAQGGGARIVIKGDCHISARLNAQGGSSEVVVKGKRTGVRAATTKSTLRDRLSPLDNMMWDMDRYMSQVVQFQSSGKDSVSVQSAGDLGVVQVENGRVWIDGEEITKKKVKATDTPPEAPHGTLTVQKSHRPRELWGS